MKAIVYRRYGPPEVLQLEEVTTPSPKAGEVRIRIRATTVNKGDCEMRRPEIPNGIWFLVRLFFGFRRPRKKILGAYFAGDIEAVGESVHGLQVGDPVFAASGPRFGAYAEYLCLPAKGSIARKPDSMSYAEAAAVPLGGLNALHYLRQAELTAGQRILINGAGGSFGTYAVQLAKHLGAEVTAVDSGDKLEMLQSIGADHVIDYEQADFASGDPQYDVVFDVVCNRYAACLRSLRDGGTYLLTNPQGLGQMLRARLASLTGRKRIVLQFAGETAAELDELRELVEAGALRSVVDRCYPLDEAVEAHRYVESGHKLGSVVLTI